MGGGLDLAVAIAFSLVTKLYTVVVGGVEEMGSPLAPGIHNHKKWGPGVEGVSCRGGTGG